MNTYNLEKEYGIGYTNKGEEFYFDLEDYEKIKDYTWLLNSDGYVITKHPKTKKIIKLSRFLLDIQEDNIVVAYDNKNKIDNRKDNLIPRTRKENSKNRQKNKNNTSGTTGVYWRKDIEKWESAIKINGKKQHIAFFNSKEEAIKSRIKAEEENGFNNK